MERVLNLPSHNRALLQFAELLLKPVVVELLLVRIVNLPQLQQVPVEFSLDSTPLFPDRVQFVLVVSRSARPLDSLHHRFPFRSIVSFGEDFPRRISGCDIAKEVIELLLNFRPCRIQHAHRVLQAARCALSDVANGTNGVASALEAGPIPTALLPSRQLVEAPVQLLLNARPILCQLEKPVARVVRHFSALGTALHQTMMLLQRGGQEIGPPARQACTRIVCEPRGIGQQVMHI
mmetsp:Transcript_2861/g.8230  ORF Transcript_2861/g.8230 Transcript_2861/m.8230 type:complete len:235 (-) Transcript_2861:119-823(-)